MKMKADHYDYLIIGGGFYGCCLALFLRSVSKKVVVIEAEPNLMTRASRVNQARVHTGFHYPRSALTAVKSMILHRRFIDDFAEAVVGDFQMLYAVAKRNSKASAKRFFRIFNELGAPIERASPQQIALFNPKMIDAVFNCREYAFDYSKLAAMMSDRLAKAGVDVLLSTSVLSITDGNERVVVGLSTGNELSAPLAFNATYSNLNGMLATADLPRAALKHELAEIALITPPTSLMGHAVTVMDGPFFSCMPYPAEGLYSLSHVRYTPHRSWKGCPSKKVEAALLSGCLPESRFRHMLNDAARFIPSMVESEYEKSLFEFKTVLIKNEVDDGRPILYQRDPVDSRVISILGGKIDNIYDLFDMVRTTLPLASVPSSAFVTS